MSAPVANLVIFAGATVLALALFWPRYGVVPRWLRDRVVTSRVRIEDALKHVYHQQDAGGSATIASVGGVLQVAPGQVVALVERMQHGGLVRFLDGRVLLTEDGERYALQVIRAHRLWERYLADETGIDPLHWHARAERREHRLTPRETDALSERLGNPRFDPHGDPIPTANGEMQSPDGTVLLLSELDVGSRGEVVHVEDEPEVVFRELLGRGIHLGMEIFVRSRSDRGIAIAAEGRDVTLAPLAAANVSVRPRPTAVALDGRSSAPAPQTLADLDLGRSASVTRISPACRGIERRRLMDLGIVAGTAITPERRSLTGDPTVYLVRGTRLALRREQAMAILVEPDGESRREAS